MANMRIGGLASGMDIDQIVGDLMKAQRIPINKLGQKKQILEWQRDDYRSMNKLLNDLDRFMFDGIMRLSSFTQKTVTSSDESKVTVKNQNAVSNQGSTIEVHELASAAKMVGASSIVKPTATFDPSGKLADQRANLSSDFTQTDIFIKAINADGTMPVDPVQINFDPATDSLNSVIEKINNSQAGVVAFFDSVTGKMSITAKNTGNNASGPEIELSGDFLTGSMNLDSNNDLAVPSSRGRSGTDADFTINGLRTTRSSNTFNINGFEYNLKGITTGEVRISSSTNIDAIFNSVKGFVDKYNETIGAINKELTEERYRKYQPLSDEEKEGMSEKQIELWEEKARSGILRNDSILSSAMNQMRLDFYSRVGVDGDSIKDNFDQLNDIGITTGNYRDKGKLVIDETKLKEALSKDPNAVYQLFNNDGTSYEAKGLAQRLRDTIKTTVEKIEKRAGNALRTNAQFTIGKNLISVDKQIESFEDKLIKIEDRYWRQFTAMEKAIMRSNDQAMYLMQQFNM
ncbi:flagellar hook-associated protein 2 [Mesobacillus subterraneus]|uniref:flagellar hook-associated protein 2 n=1 Tax=Mesobacillus subterraneus TaxID=285983 RepID=UPI001CFE8DA9|nr:flagellar hook-associated protein 2 [Mesobacillus subterraneus]